MIGECCFSLTIICGTFEGIDSMIILTIIIILIASWGIYEFYFFLTHRCPLNNDEIRLLAEKRRIINLKAYFNFTSIERVANTEFKSKMKSSGKLYSVDENLSEMPDLAAALLKHKKHEWVILAFEANQKIKCIWLNKGRDKTSVRIFLSNEEIMNFSAENQISTVLCFHNHPNSNPQYYICSKPSQADLDSATNSFNILKNAGINLIEFVCERGKHYNYYYGISDLFLPSVVFENQIECENNKGDKENYKLHKELRRSKNIRKFWN